MTNAAGTGDARIEALSRFAARALSTTAYQLAPASADASFRRYFRITPDAPWRGHATLIVMDAPPPMEDCRPFVHVSQLMRDAGLNAPAVLADDLAKASCCSPTSARDLPCGARREVRPGALQRRDQCARPLAAGFARRRVASVRRSAAHARACALPGLVRREASRPDADARAAARCLPTRFDSSSTTISRRPKVFVHRDYHSRNLMRTEPNPGILDFQDAVEGPVTYDLASLLRDAYIEWSEEQQIDWAVRYWQRARAAALPVAADFSAFWRDFEWMGVQRQLKVLGIFRPPPSPRRQGRVPGRHAARACLPSPGVRALRRAASPARSPRHDPRQRIMTRAAAIRTSDIDGASR
jgi:hypothetical protein